MPGSGKSTLGKALARELQILFIDLDQEISDKEGKSITEIFSSKGESLFRDLERKALQNTFTNSSTAVIATGGGAPCFFDNMELMNQAGITIYLNVPLVELKKRLSADGPGRPMLMGKTDEELNNFLSNKLSDRKLYYEQAKIKIYGDRIQSQDLMNQLKDKRFIF